MIFGGSRGPVDKDRTGEEVGRLAEEVGDTVRRVLAESSQVARCLARNEGPRGITANSICPGWVDTAMARPDVAARKAEIEAEIPLGRIATPEDCARAILFYLSPLAPYANGTALGLNGGSFLH